MYGSRVVNYNCHHFVLRSWEDWCRIPIKPMQEDFSKFVYRMDTKMWVVFSEVFLLLSRALIQYLPSICNHVSVFRGQLSLHKLLETREPEHQCVVRAKATCSHLPNSNMCGVLLSQHMSCPPHSHGGEDAHWKKTSGSVWATGPPTPSPGDLPMQGCSNYVASVPYSHSTSSSRCRKMLYPIFLCKCFLPRRDKKSPWYYTNK